MQKWCTVASKQEYGTKEKWKWLNCWLNWPLKAKRKVEESYMLFIGSDFCTAIGKWKSGFHETLEKSLNSYHPERFILPYRIHFRPRMLRDVSTMDISTKLLGTEISFPVGIAPTGFHQLAWPDGEKSTARGSLLLFCHVARRGVVENLKKLLGWLQARLRKIFRLEGANSFPPFWHPFLWMTHVGLVTQSTWEAL